MIEFKDKRTGEIKTAYSAQIIEGKVCIKFSETGREYAYSKENIELIKMNEEQNERQIPFTVYTFPKICYNCHESTDIITYIKFKDGTNDDVVFPWDKGRLIEHQDIIAHLKDPTIEYYGLKVVGDDTKFDNMLMRKYPQKIKKKYSQTTKTTYPMNVCSTCGAIQGWYYVYRDINEIIKKMDAIEVVE